MSYFNPTVMSILKSNNPKDMILNILSQNAQSNPAMGNVLQMANSGDVKGLQNFAMNLCKEKGVNPEDIIKELNSYKY